MAIDFVVDSVHGLIMNNLPMKTTRTPSGWITLNCPMCGDQRKRGGVISNGAKISYNCFNCKYTTGWSPNSNLGKKYKELAIKLGATASQIHDVQLNIMKHSDALAALHNDTYVYNLAKFQKVHLPEGAINFDQLPHDHELTQYARQRGILGLTPLWHFPDLTYNKRVVVPFMYNGELVGWSGRHIAPPNKTVPKFLHKMTTGYVFNIDKFANDHRKIVIVVEGLFDAILIDGVAVLGNHVTAEQAHLISQLGKRVILCPDRDEAGKELIEQALELGWEVSFPPWHDDIKDAADAVSRYGRLLTVASIIAHATNNKIKTQVMTKFL
jgi:transposase-like protein